MTIVAIAAVALASAALAVGLAYTAMSQVLQVVTASAQRSGKRLD